MVYKEVNKSFQSLEKQLKTLNRWLKLIKRNKFRVYTEAEESAERTVCENIYRDQAQSNKIFDE